MSNDTLRRRAAGKALLAGALIAIPLTATVSYAESQTVEEAFADQDVPAAPEPPAPPGPPAAPGAPLPPEAPEAPNVEEIERNVWREVHEEKMEDGKVKRTEKVYVIKGGEHLSDKERKEIRMELKEAHAESSEARAEAKAARAEALREMRIAMKEMGDVRAITEEALAEVKLELESMDGHTTKVKMSCEGEDIASEKIAADGTKTVMICKSKVMAEALSGLQEARAEIAQDTSMDSEIRAEVLRALDEQIKNWDS